MTPSSQIEADDTVQTRSVVLVTGAARGIGLATARYFHQRGWCVGLLDIEADTLRASVENLGPAERLLACPANVASAHEVGAAVDALMDRFGQIDALVNNAGTATFRPVLETGLDEWQHMIDINLTGPFICSQACARYMLDDDLAQRPGGRSIVNVASISGLRASTLRVAYGTSKAGLMHLTRQLAAEWGTLGLRVNAVAPGPVETEMARQVHSPEIRRGYHDAIPLGRYGTEEEMASVIHFLCSPQASYVNGQILAVDGGFDATGVGLPALRQARTAAMADNR